MSGNNQSPIELELLEATGQKPRGKKEDVNDFLVRLCTAVSELSDDEYSGLSEPTQNWFSAAAEKINDEDFDNVPAFADFEQAEEKPAAKGKKAAAKEEPADEPEAGEVGSYVKVTDADDEEVEGEVTANTGKKITVKDEEGEEHTFFLSKVEVEAAEKPEAKPAKGKKAAAKEEPADEPEAGEVGSYVKVTDADDEEVEGEVTANTGKKITVTDADGEEHSFMLSKVEVEAAEKPAPKKGKEKPAAKGKEDKPPKDVPKDAPKTVSGSDLVRALVCENFDSMEKDAIFKLARKKGVEVSDTQLNTVYATTMRTIEILKELGRIAEAD